MKTWLKRLAFSLVVLIVLAFVGIAIFLLTFDANSYKNKIEEIVQQKYHRSLQINGDIKVSWFPRVGLSVNKLVLTEPNSKDEFVSLDSARFAVASWPLLFNRFVVDHVAVSGFKAQILHKKDGSYNFDDLLNHVSNTDNVSVNSDPQSIDRTDFKIDIAGLDLQKGAIYYNDEVDNSAMRLINLNINTGRVTFDQAFDIFVNGRIQGESPYADAALKAQGSLKLDPALRVYNVQKLDFNINGDLGNLKSNKVSITGNLNFDGVTRALTGDNVELRLNGQGNSVNNLKNVAINVQAPKLNFDPTSPAFLVKNFSVLVSAEKADDQKYELTLDSPDLNISPKGAQGKPVNGSLKVSGKDKFSATFSLDQLSGTATALNLGKVTLDSLYSPSSDRLISLNIKSPAVLNLLDRVYNFNAVSGTISSENSRKQKLDVPIIGSISGDLQKHTAKLSADALVNNGKLSLTAVMAAEDANLHFDVKANELDIDKVINSTENGVDATTAAKPSDDKSTAPSQNSSDDTNAANTKALDDAKAAADAKAKLNFNSVPKNLLALFDGATGKIDFKKVIYKGVNIEQVRSKFAIDNQEFKISQLDGSVFGGKAQGTANFDLNSEAINAQLNFKNIQADSFVKAASIRLPIMSGRGDLDLQLKYPSVLVDQALSGVQGVIKANLKDGTIGGFDLDAFLQEPLDSSSYLDSQAHALSLDMNQQTAFKRAVFETTIKDGAFDLNKLQISGKNYSLGLATAQIGKVDFVNNALLVPLSLSIQKKLTLNLAKVRMILNSLKVPVSVSGTLDKPMFSVNVDAFKPGLKNLIKAKSDELNAQQANSTSTKAGE